MMITIKEGDSGLFFATSEDEPSFFVSATGADDIWVAIPCALEDMFRDRDDLEIVAFPTNKGDFAHKPWAIVPKKLCAAVASEKN